MKKKTWDVTVKDNPNKVVMGENDEFYTSDTEAYLIFNLKDKFFRPRTAILTLENRNDGSLKSEEIAVADGIIEWEMPQRYIEHFGNWQGQLVYEDTKDGQPELYTSAPFTFVVNAHIGDKKKPSLVEIENWEKFIREGTELIETWEDLEALREENEQQRQDNYQELLDTGVLQTNINNKLEQLEEEYAPKLTDVTAQLAQTKEDTEMLQKDFSEQPALTPYQFGAVGDGKHHPLSERFNTIEEAKDAYPHATSLSDSLDWVALVSFFKLLADDNTSNYECNGNFSINKPIDIVGMQPSRVTGNATFRATEPMEYMLNVKTGHFKWVGVTWFIGGTSDVYKDFLVNTGVIIGNGKTNASNIHFDSIRCYRMRYNGVKCIEWAFFSSFGEIVCYLVGQRNLNSSFTTLDTKGHDFSGSSILSVDVLPPNDLETSVRLGDDGVIVSINKEPYYVTNIDYQNSQITIQTKIDSQIDTGELSYMYGSAFQTHGGNTSGFNIGTLYTSGSGIGLNVSSLYGGFVGFFSSEYNGVSIKIGSSTFDNTSMGTAISNSYFEADTFNLINFTRSHNPIKIDSEINLSPYKIWNMNAYRNFPDYDGGRRTPLYSGIQNSTINIDGINHFRYKYERNIKHNIVLDVTNPHQRVNVYKTNAERFKITAKKELNRLFGYDHLEVTVIGTGSSNSPTGTITFNPATDFTVNGTTSVSFTELEGVTTFIVFYEVDSSNFLIVKK